VHERHGSLWRSPLRSPRNSEEYPHEKSLHIVRLPILARARTPCWLERPTFGPRSCAKGIVGRSTQSNSETLGKVFTRCLNGLPRTQVKKARITPLQLRSSPSSLPEARPTELVSNVAPWRAEGSFSVGPVTRLACPGQAPMAAISSIPVLLRDGGAKGRRSGERDHVSTSMLNGHGVFTSVTQNIV